MFFGKRSQRCASCNSKINGKFSYCPYCGMDLADKEKEARKYGLLGRADKSDMSEQVPFVRMGVTEKLLGSLVNNLAKSLDKQFKQMEKEFGKLENAEVESFPNGIRIRIGAKVPARAEQKKKVGKRITEEQLKKFASLPRSTAEAKVRRLGDKLVYELVIPGIVSPDDIFISKLESGYEIKAIADKKIYVNSIPVNLPIRGVAINSDRLFVEFYPNNNF